MPIIDKELWAMLGKLQDAEAETTEPDAAALPRAQVEQPQQSGVLNTIAGTFGSQAAPAAAPEFEILTPIERQILGCLAAWQTGDLKPH